MVSGHTNREIPIDVDIVPKDELWDGEMQTTQINFVKIDIEGYEFRALESGKKLLHRCKPITMFEYSTHYYSLLGYDWIEVCQFFDDMKYDLMNMEGKLLTREIRMEGQLFWNILAIPHGSVIEHSVYRKGD